MVMGGQHCPICGADTGCVAGPCRNCEESLPSFPEQEEKPKMNTKTFTAYAARSKKTGRYFRFEELCHRGTDCGCGYGHYVDDVDLKYFTPGDTPPALWSTSEPKSFNEFRDHTAKEVEFVKVTTTYEERG